MHVTNLQSESGYILRAITGITYNVVSIVHQFVIAHNIVIIYYSGISMAKPVYTHG